LPEEGNHQAHAQEVFNATAQKVMKDAISYAHIQVNNTYYKEQYNQVNVSMSFYIQCSLLVFT
jgi:hypothetical protein